MIENMQVVDNPKLEYLDPDYIDEDYVHSMDKNDGQKH